MTIRSYSEMIRFEDFESRLEYLKVRQPVGDETFGFERYLNQRFYKSRQWLDMRDYVIARDYSMDLGVPGCTIRGKMLVHHMNPITPHDLATGNPDILNPEYLITVSHETHNRIHYMDRKEPTLPQERRPGDTQLWERTW